MEMKSKTVQEYRDEIVIKQLQKETWNDAINISISLVKKHLYMSDDWRVSTLEEELKELLR